MTREVEHDLPYLLEREIRNLRDQTSEFTAEFAPMQNTDLEQLIDAQTEIADAAQWRAEAAMAELRLRRLASIVTT